MKDGRFFRDRKGNMRLLEQRASKMALQPGKTVDDLFFAHPRERGETYLKHLACAFSLGAHLVAAGICAMIHGIIPALFTTTAGDVVFRISETIRSRRMPQ